MTIKAFFDWSDFTEDTSAFGLIRESCRTAHEFDAYGDRRKFKAICLTPAYELSSTEAVGLGGLGQGSAVAKFSFKARIIDENSPHSFLPNPCNLANADDTQTSINIVQQHTTFISFTDPKTGHALKPQIGDIVQVELNKDTFSYNLQYGRFLKIIRRGSASTIGAGCASLKAAFPSATPSPRVRNYDNIGKLCGNYSRNKALAETIGIPPDVMNAFAAVESNGNPRAIRFEPHVFNRKSSTQIPWTNNGSGFSNVASETNKSAFKKAYQIDKVAAIESTSWGSYQVMGHHLLKINSNPDAAVAMFEADPQGVSDKMVASWFSGNNSACNAARSRDFKTLARRYNGPAYAANAYDVNLKSASEASKKC